MHIYIYIKRILIKLINQINTNLNAVNLKLDLYMLMHVVARLNDKKKWVFANHVWCMNMNMNMNINIIINYDYN